jgi:hypothetical protein
MSHAVMGPLRGWLTSRAPQTGSQTFILNYITSVRVCTTQTTPVGRSGCRVYFTVGCCLPCWGLACMDGTCGRRAAAAQGHGNLTPQPLALMQGPKYGLRTPFRGGTLQVC